MMARKPTEPPDSAGRGGAHRMRQGELTTGREKVRTRTGDRQRLLIKTISTTQQTHLSAMETT